MIRAMIRFALACLLLVVALPVATQSNDALPGQSGYRGEIRRGPDGRLTVIEKAPSGIGFGAAPQKPATMLVGPGERIATISEAAKRARDGEVIEIAPGDYRGQPAVWTQDNLLIRGRGERPVMIADGRNAEDKAIWVIRGGHIRVENIEFRGARVAQGNGAGIRFERGHLVVDRCGFFDNEMGLLTANSEDMTLKVSDSEFGEAPRHEGPLHHLLYAGAIGRLELSGSRFTNGYLGHLVKSRARVNDVRYNVMADGKGGQASYELEFPNGGVAYVIGNVVEQSAATDNQALVSYGAEGPRWPDNALYFTHNTLINDFPVGTFLKLAVDKFPEGIETWVINNLTVGEGELPPPPQGRFEGNTPVPRRDLLVDGGLPLRLNVTSPLRGSVRIPGSAAGVDLLPSAEFVFPAGSRRINLGRSLAPGAFQ